MLDALPNETFRALAISSNEMRASSLIQPTPRCTFFFFFFLPCGKCLISQTEKKIAHWKTVAFEGAGYSLADRSSERISVTDCPRMVRTLMQDRQSAAESHTLRQCLWLSHTHTKAEVK